MRFPSAVKKMALTIQDGDRVSIVLFGDSDASYFYYLCRKKY